MNWVDILEAELDVMAATPGHPRFMATICRELGGPRALIDYYEAHPEHFIRDFTKAIPATTRPEPPPVSPPRDEVRVRVSNVLEPGPLDRH